MGIYRSLDARCSMLKVKSFHSLLNQSSGEYLSLSLFLLILRVRVCVCVLFVYKSNVCYMPGMLYRSWSEEGEESAGVIGDMQMLMVHSTPHDAPLLSLLSLQSSSHTTPHHTTPPTYLVSFFLYKSHLHTHTNGA